VISSDTRVILFGLGGVGRTVTSLLHSRSGFRIVAAHSRNPAWTGLDLGELAGIGPLGVGITNDCAATLAVPADIAVIATTSFLRDVNDDIRSAVAAGLNVICTAEELAFPWAVDEALANELDRLARQHQVTVLGAGLNPGFIFDALALTAAGATWNVAHIAVRRVVNLSKFSATVLRRLGLGFAASEFAQLVAEGRIHGHIGFPQSMRIVANKLQVRIERIDCRIEPLLASRVYEMPHLTVHENHSAGFIQRYAAMVDDERWFEAELIGHADPESVGFPRADTIDILGVAPIHLQLRPGCDPQLSSAAVIANSLRRVIESAPGLVTVADLPPATPTFYGRNGTEMPLITSKLHS
jgi:2,4-diaminopentanoate dehydrogenase